MTGLIEDFCRSGRRNVAKTSREAFPYLLKLLNACRVILEQNVQKWDASPQEDPVYELIKKVADILVQYSEPNVKFNMQDLLEKVKAIPTKISNFSQGIEREFNKLKPIEEQKAQALRQTTGKLERFLKKAGSVISSDETFHVEVVLYKEPCKTELAGPVSNCRPDNTVDLLLLDLLVQGHFRKDISLQDNPHFFPRARGRSDPIPFRLDPLPFHQILETINGRKTKYSEPLKLYCVMDQWRYPRLLLKAVPQRAFTNLWVLPDGEILIKEITGKFVSSKDKKMVEAYKSGTHHITKKFNSKDVEDSRPEVGLSWKQLLETMRESSSENWSIEVKALETLHEDSRFGDSDSEESAETIDEVVYLSAESEKKKPESLGSGRPKFDWSDTSQTLVGSADLVTRKVWSLEEQFAPKRDGLPVQDKVIPQGTQLHRRKDRVTQMSMAYEPVVPSRVAPPARDVIRPLQSSSHPLRATGPYAHLGSDEDSSRTQRTQDASQTANKKPNRLTPERFTPFSQNAEQKFPNDRPRHLRLTKPSSRDDASPGNTPTFVRARPDPIDNPRNGVATQVKENLRRGSTTLNVSNSSIRPDTAISSHHDDPTPQGGKHDRTSELTNSSNLRRDEFVEESERIPSGARPGKRESNAHTLQSTQPHVQNGHSPPSAPIVQSRPGTPSHFRSSRPSNVPPSDLAGNATSPPRGQEPRSHAQKFDGRGPPEPSTHKSSPLPKQSMQPVDVSYIYPTPAQPKKRADLVDITSARANGASTTTNQTSPSTAQSSSSSSRNHLPAADTVSTTKNTESPVRPGTPAKEDQQHTNHSRSSTPTAKPNTAAWEASLSRNLAALERQGGGQEGKMTSVLPTVGSKSAGDNQHVPMKQDARTTTPQPLPSPTPPAPGRRRRWYDPIVDAIWRK